MATDILVVDDEADIRELVSGILTDEGYAVRTAADSASASPIRTPSSTWKSRTRASPSPATDG